MCAFVRAAERQRGALGGNGRREQCLVRGNELLYVVGGAQIRRDEWVEDLIPLQGPGIRSTAKIAGVSIFAVFRVYSP